MDDPPPLERLVQSPAVRSGYASTLAHVGILTILALFFAERPSQPKSPRLVIDTSAAPDDDPAPGDLPEAPAEIPLAIAAADPAVTPAVAAPFAIREPLPVPDQIVAAGDAQPPLTDLLAELATPAAERRISAPAEASPALRPFAARRGDARTAAVAARGGSAASEAAVERGLAWLALHQAHDGSWRFDLSGCRCDGICTQRGTVTSTTAATGLALLPFLGAGHTQLEGRYREVVNRGLYYLLSRLEPTPRGGDLTEGTLYGQGVATLALAEAFGMTRDDALAKPLADAVRFIVTSQDLHGGGWRYLPGQAGDTTVTAWQFAALKSAGLSGLAVPSPAIDGVARFLDRVQTPDGTGYGYLAPSARSCTSAIGLFCRLHLGWDRRDALEQGLTRLARPGPAADAIYQNFYLAQALVLAEHPAWPGWNRRYRELLIRMQGPTGHEAGSWFFADRDTAPGGRLAHTALAVLTLEVYYRILPLYRAESIAGSP